MLITTRTAWARVCQYITEIYPLLNFQLIFVCMSISWISPIPLMVTTALPDGQKLDTFPDLYISVLQIL